MTERANYQTYMRRCISLATIAKQRGDSPVGSVLVKHEKIIAEGIEGRKMHQDITWHAEIEAVRKNLKTFKTNDLCKCILVTIYESCIMCS